MQIICRLALFGASYLFILLLPGGIDSLQAGQRTITVATNEYPPYHVPAIRITVCPM
jgi:hypothetical protein